MSFELVDYFWQYYQIIMHLNAIDLKKNTTNGKRKV